MSDEDRLREKLRAIEALFAGATTDGERDAAGAARQRIVDRIEREHAERIVVWRFTGLDTWQQRLLRALSARYGLRPFRYARERRTTVNVRAPEAFLRDVFTPEFERMSETLHAHLEGVAARVIAEVLETEVPTPEVEELALLSD